MFSFHPRKTKRGLRMRVNHAEHDAVGELRHEVKEMFIGHHTIFSLIGLAVGGTLIGKTLWEWLAVWLGLPLTLVIGVLIFILSGISLHSFDDRNYTRQDEDLIDEIIK